MITRRLLLSTSTHYPSASRLNAIHQVRFDALQVLPLSRLVNLQIRHEHDDSSSATVVIRTGRQATLLDADGNIPFTPTVDPDMRITADPLPPDLQKAVYEHVEAACHKPVHHKRHLIRHWRLDTPKKKKRNKKRPKKKKLRAPFLITPFVVIGAFQRLVARVRNRQPGKGDIRATKEILNADFSFSFFQTLSDKIDAKYGERYTFKEKFPLPSRPWNDSKMLILSELLVMYARPLLTPYLPPHAWCLREDPIPVPEIKALEPIGRDVEYDTGRYYFMFWDLAVDGHVEFNDIHIKCVVNMLKPYAQDWWLSTLFKIYNVNRKFSGKGKKTWEVTVDSTSSLPAFLVDLLLSRLDFSDVLKKHPLKVALSERLKSDKKKEKVGVVKIGRKIPEKIEDSAHLDYHRLGPVILASFQGPKKLREKVKRGIDLELKSSLRFDRRLIESRAFSVKGPRREGTKGEIKEEKASEEKFEKHEKIFEIAAAGTKKTKNRKRIRLQEEGRELGLIRSL